MLPRPLSLQSWYVLLLLVPWRRGLPWLLVLILVLSAASVRQFAVRPMQSALSIQAAELGVAKRRAVPAPKPVSISQQIDRSLAQFPSTDSAPSTIRALEALASKEQLSIPTLALQWTEDTHQDLTKLSFLLPLKTTDNQARAFLAKARAQFPTLAIEKIKFKRDDIASQTLESEISLAIYFRRVAS